LATPLSFSETTVKCGRPGEQPAVHTGVALMELGHGKEEIGEFEKTDLFP